MAMIVALVVIVFGSVLFHLLSPWWATPLASNWHQMDSMLTITVLITGLFFVVLNLFLVYTLIRFRHREHSRAVYEADNPKLERWLIIATSAGIIALLAPGLFVYAEYVQTPRNALVVDVLGQQWQWRFRFAGSDGKFGASNVRLATASNPFGIAANDPSGQNNIIISNGELHLPLGRPVKMLLRSNDVLHDFFVPPFRARMNIVPGMISSFWFTPTKAGRYEAMCAQLCGIGHSNMRAYVIVEPVADFEKWLKAQPTFAAGLSQTRNKPEADASNPLVAQGKALYLSKGCVACHSVDGSKGVGPGWKGLYGKTETMSDGSTALVDAAYLKKFILEPTARVIQGYAPIMPKIELTETELAALVAYIQTLDPVPVKSAAAPTQAEK
ncbi:cytochrome c oxidase subunit II [Undibacterium sp. Jales W-56]|uniref:cytochrome c oxidase subunit II n=1 Tax=Undibacterium sp. Jales W-56 TaxID=2897325 RepID=UPI0021D1CF7C|nr:cytochrome c oxidase subunit II [Undibacterium sp. Jales W-56]MCU6434484.1 cytochrome c oxidase subunit II [Undibacterium sp. Jales W-56]